MRYIEIQILVWPEIPWLFWEDSKAFAIGGNRYDHTYPNLTNIMQKVGIIEMKMHYNSASCAILVHNACVAPSVAVPKPRKLAAAAQSEKFHCGQFIA